ncbi:MULTISPECIES: serine--tRNA ligase [unclassified Lentimonas]|uniref:serine--tRNA ligase n=1 Tax=unclassified Lentimonas TaxID=2630993 RepID=UPI00132A6FD6|nr:MULTISPECIES: serine--tRNA ligase [unclassified Lentimonas]CAA6676964.1 Seryl-tRNA synthetase (EC [Lentimonas sp. CC4]CAA6686770.1 Seryl-tRNA synthetase (EC [Lentimonas sp. CC6]CAA7075652.1 Seryl-tRNA synthetase (EC [Lentimonas sp. CC4]CAA7168189.1 Seryl-tRNA synthetase (EC [Lentimonas sp. CC21]CAA7181659.1 Seryl-tRNA synthetase (EC [Lentimonas sp. CC8]
MIDIKLLREQPDFVRAAIANKKFTCDIDAILAFDTTRRAKITDAEQARAAQKAANKEMAALPKGTPEFIAKVQEMKAIAGKAKELEAAAKEADEAFQEAFLSIPNLADPSTPIGKNEDENEVAATWGDADAEFPNALPHFDIPWFESRVDFARGVKVAGAGFPFYVGEMSRLVRALVNFFLEEARQAGYEEMLPPIVVNEESATATGQLPDKEGQMYVDPNEGLYLIPTAEVPVTNFYRDEIIDADQLPLRHCAYTPCFRREAGSWGAHVRGLNRLHQFDKVELVKWTDADSSMEELEKLRGDVEQLLQKLELPYRVLRMCTGDIGFPHAKQYDLEVFAAGQKRWLEVSSCSNFTDFQARRAGIRYRGADGKPVTAHTLNGSALAVPRVLAAILENNLQADGRVKVPACLQYWMQQEFIGVAK